MRGRGARGRGARGRGGERVACVAQYAAAPRALAAARAQALPDELRHARVGAGRVQLAHGGRDGGLHVVQPVHQPVTTV